MLNLILAYTIACYVAFLTTYVVVNLFLLIVLVFLIVQLTRSFSIVNIVKVYKFVPISCICTRCPRLIAPLSPLVGLGTLVVLLSRLIVPIIVIARSLIKQLFF